jgi:uncharacterized membrane protein
VFIVVLERRRSTAISELLHQLSAKQLEQSARRQIRAALDDRGSLSENEVVAVEVVWSPAAEQDLMSVAEMEASYPELERIDRAAG